MEITIGVQRIGRELTIETSQSASQVAADVAAALEKGTGLLSLTDNKGRVTLIPATAVGYVQIGAENQRFVGFSA